MALAFSHITHAGAAGSAARYDTNSFTPTAGSLLFAVISHINNALVSNVTASFGLASNFTQVNVVQINGTPYVSTWYGVANGAPGAGTMTWSFGAAENRLYVGYGVDQVTGQAASPLGTSGTSQTGGSNCTLTLAAFTDANSRYYAFGMDWGGTTNGAVWSSLTDLGKWLTGGDTYTVLSGYNPSASSNVASLVPGSGTAGIGMIGVEVKALAASGATTDNPWVRSIQVRSPTVLP